MLRHTSIFNSVEAMWQRDERLVLSAVALRPVFLVAVVGAVEAVGGGLE
jgi:nitrate reductase NapE component